MALRKSAHAVFEDRMRVIALRLDRPEGYGFSSVSVPADQHPLDGWAEASLRQAAALPVTTQEPSGGGTIRLWFSAMAWSAALLGAAGRHLLSRYPEAAPCHADVATPNFWPEDRLRPLIDAARENDLWRDGSIVVVKERGDIPMPASLPVQAYDPLTSRVPRRVWWNSVILPSLRLVARAAMLLLRHGRDPRAAFLISESCHLACLSVPIWRTGFALRTRFYLDSAEYNAVHALKAVIFRKFGMKVIRWPHTLMDGHGVNLSFLAYEMFLSAGLYEWRHLSTTWSSRCKPLAVGPLQADRRMRGLQRLNPSYRSWIEDRLTQGVRMLVYFGPTFMPTLHGPALDIARLLIEAVSKQPTWILVIKAKIANALYEGMDADPGLNGWRQNTQVLPIEYETPGAEMCPAGWLIERMELGVSLLGSVQIEAVVAGKACVAYYPIFQPSPARLRLRAAGLFFDDLADFGGAIEKWLSGRTKIPRHFDWFKDNFDAAQPGEALDRVVRLLFGKDNVNARNTPSREDRLPAELQNDPLARAEEVR